MRLAFNWKHWELALWSRLTTDKGPIGFHARTKTDGNAINEAGWRSTQNSIWAYTYGCFTCD